MITEIGALVAIVKTLLDATKTGIEIFGGGKKKASDAFKKAQERLEGIAEQLYQSVALSKMLPIWLKEFSAVDLYAQNLSDEDVKLLESSLRALISDSIHDHFSGTFFQTSFAVLPDVDAAIRNFRQRLLDLEKQLDGIPPGDAVAWRHTWPVLKVRLHDLRVEATKLDQLAEDIHSKLVTELRDAAKLRAV